MDVPYIVDPETNNNRYGASVDIFASQPPKRKDYNDSNSSSGTECGLVHKKQIDRIITQFQKPRPASLGPITSFPTSSVTSPSFSDSDSSSCLSITPSMIPEECPCKCGSFLGSCYALTPPPSPLHFWIRGVEGEPAQHLFVNDFQQFKNMQRIELDNTLQELNVRLDRLRDTKSPPRSTLPWSEPKVQLDISDETGSKSKRQTSDGKLFPPTIFRRRTGLLTQGEGPQSYSKSPDETAPKPQSRRDSTIYLRDKIALRINPGHQLPGQAKATVSSTGRTVPTSAPESRTLPNQASRKLSPSACEPQQQRTNTKRIATKTVVLPTSRKRNSLRRQASTTQESGCKADNGPRLERSSSPKRLRDSDEDIKGEDEERRAKKRH